MPIFFRGCDIDDVFLTEADLMNRFVGQELWLWGYSATGQLGNNAALINRSSPVQTVSVTTNWSCVSGGINTFSAIKNDGTLWSWGVNTAGGIGDGTIITRSSPVQIAGTTWKTISVGCHRVAVKTNGTLFSWGFGTTGALGNATSTSRSSPVQTSTAGTNWRNAVAGIYHTVATKTDGSLWTWGNGGNGRLGINATANRSIPVQTTSATTDWKFIEAGETSSFSIKTDGTLFSWGAAAGGLLANDSGIVNRSTPAQTVSNVSTWKSVAACKHVAAIKIDGTLWTWGCGLGGTLGNNTDVLNRSSPIQTVSGGSEWRSVAVGGFHTTAIKADGTLWVWGCNAQGQLGTNNTTSVSSPTQTAAGGNTWRSLGNAYRSTATTQITQ